MTGTAPDVPAAAETAAETAYERSARRCLRAYPPRWRAAREDEVVGVLLDTRPAGATGLGAAARWDLVRGAAAWRLRHRPSFLVWLLWRSGHNAIPGRHVEWALDDLQGRWYHVRSLAGLRSWWVVPTFVIAEPGRWTWWLAWALLGLNVGVALLGNRLPGSRQMVQTRRERLLAPYAIAERVSRDPSVVLSTTTRWSWGRWLVPPVVAAWCSTLVAAGVVVAAVVDGATLGPPLPGLVLVPLGALTVGLMGVGTLLLLARPRVAGRPEQPWRHRVVPPHRVVRTVLLLVSLVLPWGGAQLFLESWGRTFAVPEGVASFLALTGVLGTPFLVLLLALPAVHLRTRGLLAERPSPPPALRDVLGVVGGTTVLVDPPRPYPPLPPSEPSAAVTGERARG